MPSYDVMCHDTGLQAILSRMRLRAVEDMFTGMEIFMREASRQGSVMDMAFIITRCVLQQE